jgi:hypothetical protein
MLNTTLFDPRTHEEVFTKVNQMQTGILDDEISDLMCMGSKTKLGTWKDNTLMPVITEEQAAYREHFPILTRTKAHIERLRLAEENVIPLCRHVAGMAMWNPLLTDLHLEKLGLPPRPVFTRKAAPVMTVAPHYDVIDSRIRTVSVEFGDAASGTKRKPRGQQGIECRYLVSDTPLLEVTEADLIHAAFDTRTPLVLEFAEKDRGHIVYLALRWENTRGVKGPFGPILNTRIP